VAEVCSGAEKSLTLSDFKSGAVLRNAAQGLFFAYFFQLLEKSKRIIENKKIPCAHRASRDARDFILGPVKLILATADLMPETST
jgi:hypothetical protein